MSELPELLRPGLCGRGVWAAAGTKSLEQAMIISPSRLPIIHRPVKPRISAEP